MDRIFSKGTLLVLGISAVIILLSTLFRGCSSETKIRASVSAKEVYLGDAIFYKDSTPGVREVIWEFGNGDFSTDRQGSYVFTTVGNYKIRLKAGSKSQEFVVKVRPEKTQEEREVVSILAPSFVVKNEEVVFMGEGDADTWRWNFGVGGPADSKERNVIVKFDKAGDYQVTLLAGNMKYPVYHKIHVEEDVVGRRTTGGGGTPPEDLIQRYLQNIIDHQGKYNDNYHRILTLLNGNNKMTVLINNVNENDISSYCQGLSILGKQDGTFIEKVVRDMDGSRIRRLLIEQKTAK